MMKIAGALLACVVLAGCATPVPVSRAAPPSLIQNNSYLSPTNGNSAIGLTRDSGFYGSACTMHVSVDANDIASLDPGQRIMIFIPAGSHKIGVREADICAAGGTTYFDTITHSNMINEIRLSQNGGAPTNMFIFKGEVPLQHH